MNLLESFRKVFQRIFNCYSKQEIDEWTKTLNRDFNEVTESINNILLQLRISELISERKYRELYWNLPEKPNKTEESEE